MGTRVTERVGGWNARPFDGGYAELRSLAEDDFSGVVEAGGTTVYMIAGTVVGVENGSIEDVETAEGTVYQAPTPALPLLAVMQERSDEVRAEYYSEATGLAEVDETLSSAEFTGYVELSENVLSGDYYVVYHRGRSMSAAFVGNTDTLLTDEEAFDRADGEVGIYEVRPVDVERVEIPAPATHAPDPGSEPTAAGTGRDEPDSSDPESEPTALEAGPEHDTDGADSGETPDTPGTLGAAGAAPTDTAETAASSVTGSEEASMSASQDEHGVEDDRARSDASNGKPEAEQTDTGVDQPTVDADREASAGPRPTPPDSEQTQTDDGDSGASQQDATDQGGLGAGTQESASDSQPRESPDESPAGADDSNGAIPESTTPENKRDADAARVGELESELESREAEIDRLESELERVTGERENLEAELASVREQRDELAATAERLEREVDRLRGESGDTEHEQRVTPQEALRGTDLFVRYRSKGDPTLENAHSGGVQRDDLVENLVLEEHTQFDASAVSVGGQGYEAFLEEAVEFRFVEWVTTELLFEIRETGAVDSLSTLYNAIPRIDRAEFGGTVDVGHAGSDQGEQTSETFDVVCRDRMGDPLLVATVNDSREAATASTVEQLVTAAERVGQSSDDLAGAVFVTTSFFEPGALEIASEATRSGLLSRSKHRSFVNLSRKRGYHLCLIEARSGKINLTVPEL